MRSPKASAGLGPGASNRLLNANPAEHDLHQPFRSA